MKLKPFAEIIAMTAEAKDKVLAPMRSRRVRAQAELKMSEIDEEIVGLEAEVQEECADKEIDFDELLDKLDQIALLDRRKKQYTKVLDELFPE